MVPIGLVVGLAQDLALIAAHVSRQAGEKRPGEDSASGFPHPARRFRLSLGAQQKKSAHFPYLSTYMVEQQKRPAKAKTRTFYL